MLQVKDNWFMLNTKAATANQIKSPFSSDCTGTVPGLVPDWNKVDSDRYQNIFCSEAEPC